MTLRRDEIVPGILDELDGLGELLAGLDGQAWATPSRCEGWTVADVAAHVVGTMTSVVTGQLDGLGSPEVTAREVADRKGRSPAELADELAHARKQATDMLALFDDAAFQAPAPGGYNGTLGQGIEALWYDAWVHGDDIRAALGCRSVTGPGLRAGVHHVAAVLDQQGWGPATLTLDGMEEVPIGAGGRRIAGDPLAFVLAATGRADPGPLGLDETVNIYR
jgi:uncharacterized protein (TIGR03083 family)